MMTSRGDALALHGIAKNMFSSIPAIRDSKDFEEMVVEMRIISDQKLDKTHPNWASQHQDQLRIVGFMKDHDIK